VKHKQHDPKWQEMRHLVPMCRSLGAQLIPLRGNDRRGKTTDARLRVVSVEEREFFCDYSMQVKYKEPLLFGPLA
jgi:hypothetical protein